MGGGGEIVAGTMGRGVRQRESVLLQSTGRLRKAGLRRIHFVGVSGIGVSALAHLALEQGVTVSGSADMENELTADLSKRGMTFYLGHRAEHLGRPHAVVMSAAVPLDNPEICEAERRGIPVLLYSEFLGKLMAAKRGIAVAGTHGKTTTTALLAAILSRAGLDPSVVCGGIMENFSSNAVHGKGDFFIAEACEYNRSFHDFEKRYAVVTNVEEDHLDYYRDIDDIRGAFIHFLKTVPDEGFSVVNGDDHNVKEILRAIEGRRVCRVGFSDENDYRIAGLHAERGLYRCRVMKGSERVFGIGLSVPGRFNCQNAALAGVLSLELGVQARFIERAIGEFQGTKRRMECLGAINGNLVYSDYGHHPTEIRLTIEALRELHPSKKIALVFQPHQYSRTAELFEEFVRELGACDILVLMEIYRQRDQESAVKRIGSGDLFKSLKKKGMEDIYLVPEKVEIDPFLRRLPLVDGLILFMGAGDIDDVARGYVNNTGGGGS